LDNDNIHIFNAEIVCSVDKYITPSPFETLSTMF